MKKNIIILVCFISAIIFAYLYFRKLPETKIVSYPIKEIITKSDTITKQVTKIVTRYKEARDTIELHRTDTVYVDNFIYICDSTVNSLQYALSQKDSIIDTLIFAIKQTEPLRIENKRLKRQNRILKIGLLASGLVFIIR